LRSLWDYGQFTTDSCGGHLEEKEMNCYVVISCCSTEEQEFITKACSGLFNTIEEGKDTVTVRERCSHQEHSVRREAQNKFILGLTALAEKVKARRDLYFGKQSERPSFAPL